MTRVRAAAKNAFTEPPSTAPTPDNHHDHEVVFLVVFLEDRRTATTTTSMDVKQGTAVWLDDGDFFEKHVFAFRGRAEGVEFKNKHRKCISATTEHHVPDYGPGCASTQTQAQTHKNKHRHRHR